MRASGKKRRPGGGPPKTAHGPMKAISIGAKDHKLLWARAAGRCSMSSCRKQLTLDTASKGTATLGAMAHIVGEKLNAARGKSPLSLAERNCYANLILLCGHHHDVIDADANKYPVEVVHQIKAAHELWVAERLGANEPDPDDLVYASLVDAITTALKLDQWGWFTDHAVRDLLHEDFLEARGFLNERKLAAVWPARHPRLKKAMVGVVTSFSDFVTYYETNADLRPDGFLQPDRSSFRYLHAPARLAAEERLQNWSKRCFLLLCDFVIKLNDYAAAVRRNINPLYFRLEGRFVIVDSMGYRFGGNPTVYDPQGRKLKANIAGARREARTEVIASQRSQGV